MGYFECEGRSGGKRHATWDGTKTKCGRVISPEWWVSSVPFFSDGINVCQACVKAVEKVSA